MKLRKRCAFLGAMLIACAPLFANELTFSVGVEAAYYPDNKHLSTLGDGVDKNHYSPISGAYNGLEGRITPKLNYNIPTPLGDSWLLSGANVNLQAYIGVTPVSVCPGASISFTPLPFLVFSAGAEAGTGWDLGPFTGGLGVYNYSTTDPGYDQALFSDWMLKAWFQGTFQFDTGAIILGDWTHVLMQFSYQAYYQNYTGAAAKELWIWNCGGNRVDGWYQYINAVLAYQLPIPYLKMVGVMFESDGSYSDSVYANSEYKGSFKDLSLSPLLGFTFNEHNSLNVLFHFKSRRTYETYAPDPDNEGHLLYPESLNTKTVGREWFFNRIAFSYTYSW